MKQNWYRGENKKCAFLVDVVDKCQIYQEIENQLIDNLDDREEPFEDS